MACSAVFLGILVLYPNETSLQSHEINVARQIERMQKIEDPKIIFIGGSGYGFGLSSPMIYDHFHMPVCNTGTHADIGLLSQLNLCKDYIHKGDIVVVIPEYHQYFGVGYLGQKTLLRIFSSVYPQGYKELTIRQQIHLFQYIPSAFNDAKKCRNGSFFADDNPYSMKSLNKYGDVECYESRIHKTSIDSTFEVWEHPKIQRSAIIALSDYDRFCKEKGATMLLFPPAYKAMDFDENKDFILFIWQCLVESGLPCVSYPERYRMADTLHYDTNYHLTYEGVVIRTNCLIDDMDSALLDFQN